MKLPRFSLRLLLLGVAVLCAWLAWERHVVLERRAVLARRMAWGIPAKADGARIPWHRSWFGDRAMEELLVPTNCSPRELRRLTKLFPEAYVSPFSPTRLGGLVRSQPAPVHFAPLSQYPPAR